MPDLQEQDLDELIIYKCTIDDNGDIVITARGENYVDKVITINMDVADKLISSLYNSYVK